MKIMHVITGLEIGGAETMLYKLTSNMRRDLFENMVVCMTDAGPTWEKIQAAGIRVEYLGMARGAPDPRFVLKLVTLMRDEKPDLVQTWLYHADLLGGIAARIAGIPVIWNIRQSDPRPAGTKRLTWLAALTCAKLSWLIPIRIVYCSEAARSSHYALGYNRDKFTFIPNGFDLDVFGPDPEAYVSVRSELGLAANQLIVGHAARFHPMKDHSTMLAACAIVHGVYPEAHFVLCGEEVTPDNAELMGQVIDYKMENVCHLLGRRDDMPRLAAAFDITCLSSVSGEGFPNIIGEAMACAVPCVVTDVGDSAAIVDGTGFVVLPDNAFDLAQGMIKMIAMGREERQLLGYAARQRIEQHYSMPHIVELYENLYQDIAWASKPDPDSRGGAGHPKS